MNEDDKKKLANKKGLQGFKEVLDLIDSGVSESGEHTKSKQVLDDYEIFDFLEKEYSRLGRLDELFSKKLQTIQKYPQIDILIKLQIEQRNLFRKGIISRALERESTFQQNMQSFYNQYFARKE